MKRPSTIVAGLAVAALAVVAVPTAHAANGTPLTYAQLATDPAMVASQAAVTNVMAGDFTLAGRQTDPDSGRVVTDERISHRGSSYRTWIKQGRMTQVTITDGTKSCSRRVTRALPDTYAADLKATWTCRKGSDPLTAGEIAAATPLGMAQVIDASTGGQARFVPTAVAPAGVRVTIAKPDGTPVGYYTVAGQAGGPFTVAVFRGTAATAAQTARFKTTAGAKDKIAALGSLRTR